VNLLSLLEMVLVIGLIVLFNAAQYHLLFYSSRIATARTQPLPAFLIFIENMATLNPWGVGIVSRLFRFSMWQYSFFLPANVHLGLDKNLLLMSRSVENLSSCVKKTEASSSGGRSFLAWVGSVRVWHLEDGKTGVRIFIPARAENLAKKVI
jgi:hypothetical protein